MMNLNIRFLSQACVAVCIAGAFGVSHAQENSIESISANQQGSNVIVKIAMKNPVVKPPIGFAITSPARIALDFAGTGSSLKAPMQEVGIGDVRSVNIVQAGERSRLVFNLNRPLNYATVVDGNTVIVTIEGSGGVPRAVNAAGVAQAAAAGKPAIRDIDFRRGSGGEGRVVIDLPGNQVGVDVRQQG
ncbi:MAG: AMIN domain-containing protein, partial [Noviherbaspirillum sp.]